MADPASTATTDDEPGGNDDADDRPYSVVTLFGREVKVHGPQGDFFYQENIPGAKWRTWSGEIKESRDRPIKRRIDWWFRHKIRTTFLAPVCLTIFPLVACISRDR